MKFFKKILIVFIFTVLGLGSYAEAYIVITTDSGVEVKWSSPQAVYYINSAGVPGSAVAAVQSAMQTWTDVATSKFTFIYGGTTTSTAHGTLDYINIVTSAPMGSNGTLGESYSWYDTSTGELVDCDIQFNTSYPWNTDGSAAYFDVQNIGTHEFGHSLGLDDLYGTADTEKTMYGYGDTGETKKRTLEQDDIDGITHLYPPCTYAINPASANVGASGATGSISITAGAGCGWTAVSNREWITVTSGGSGIGDGTVNYSISAYIGTTQRTGTITVAGKTFTVIQEANSGLFYPYITISTASRSDAVAIGDVNGDGRNDVVMTTGYSFSSNPANDYNFFVFLQNSSSGFLDTPIKYSTSGSYSNRPSTVAIGDMNNDGWADVVIGNSGKNIEVFFQNASGGLDPAISYSTSDSYKIRIADLNNDGLLDVVGIGWGTNTASVFLQNANETLNPSVTYSVTHDGYDDLKVGDVNNDGLTDIIVMSGQGFVPNIGVLIQKTDGTFAPVVYHDLGGNELSRGVAIGNINSDNLEDIIVTYGGNIPDSKIGVFRQNVSGGFDAPISYDSYDIPGAIEVADVTNDGKKDIIVAHSGSVALGVYRQGSGGVLISEEVYSIPYSSSFNPHRLAVGDINGDGKNDVVIAGSGNDLIVLYNRDGSLVPNISVSPKYFNFGYIITNGSAQHTFTISNTGTKNLAIGSITLKSKHVSSFSTQNDGCSGQTLIPSGSCTIQVLFSPGSTGLKTVWLSIPSNDIYTSQLDIPLSGTGVLPYNLNISKSGADLGTITSSPVGIDCGSTCSASLGGTVTLAATPSACSVFSGWSGGGCSGTGTCTVTMDAGKTVTATFNAVAPTAAFTGTPLSGASPLTVNFTDASTCGATSWNWNFGDGGTSTSQNPSHTYNPSWGSSFSVSYPVALTATNANGSNMLTKTSYIAVQCPNQPVKNTRTGVSYNTLQSAHDAAIAGDTIRSHALTSTENLTVSKAVTFDGGYNCDFTSRIGKTTLTGNLTIGAGAFTVNLDNFNLQ